MQEMPEAQSVQENEEQTEGVAEAIVEPPKKETPVAALFDFLEILVFSVCTALLLFTLVFRICRVDGRSMQNTLQHGQRLVVSNLTEIEAGDIIIFHQTSEIYDRFNEALVKRVIATEGQTVRIDYNNGEVRIDGVLLDEPYVALLSSAGHSIGKWTSSPSVPGFDRHTRVFEVVVPDGCYFVMGDNRNNSADSRNVEVGFVDTRRVLGKAILRMQPWTIYE